MKPYLNLRQICLVAPELEPVVDNVREIFGVDVCYRDPAVGKYGLVNALFVFGRAFLEIVAPVRENTTAGRFLARTGGVGGYMVIFDCDDPEVRRERAQAMGVRIAHLLQYDTYRGSQFHPVDCRATMLEFDHTDGAEDLDGPYHPAGEHWRDFQRLDRVQGISQVDIESPDHADLAAHWSRLMDRPVSAGEDDVPHIDCDLGTLRFVRAAPGTPERPCAAHVQVSDPTAVLAAAARRGLPVFAGGVFIAGMNFIPVRAGA